jgi:hypothetical protein
MSDMITFFFGAMLMAFERRICDGTSSDISVSKRKKQMKLMRASFKMRIGKYLLDICLAYRRRIDEGPGRKVTLCR